MKYMKTQTLIDKLSRGGKPVFTIHEAALLAGKKKAYLSRLLPTNKKIYRVERGKYFIEGTGTYEIASNVIFPSYLSLMAAFRYYNLTTQEPVLASVISLKSHKPIIVNETKVEFIKFSKGRFFGYKKERGVFIAYREKAILDAIYMGRPEFSAVDEVLTAALEENSIDIKRMKNFAMMMDSAVLINKMGFLLESHGINCDSLLGHRSKHYATLSPIGSPNNRWHVKI